MHRFASFRGLTCHGGFLGCRSLHKKSRLLYGVSARGSMFNPYFSCAVKKGTLIQWEEDNPPGSCCSSRKQSERGMLETASHGAFDAKGPARRDQRATRP